MDCGSRVSELTEWLVSSYSTSPTVNEEIRFEKTSSTKFITPLEDHQQVREQVV